MENRKMSIENATLMFRNFTGEKNDFNAAGQRNFNVVLDEETALRLIDDGVNVRKRESRDPEEDPIYTLKVKVSYMYQPPIAEVITKRGRKQLNESNISELDHVTIENVDLSIYFSPWTMRDGRSGYSAYLDSIYVTISTNALEEKYADLPYIE